MTQDGSQNDGEGNANLTCMEYDQTSQFDREKNPLPENITEYIQNARDGLHEYEENKKYRKISNDSSNNYAEPSQQKSTLFPFSP